VSAVRTTTGLGQITGIAVVDAASVLKTVQAAYVRTAAGLKAFFASMAASAGANVNGYGNSSSSVDVTTGTVTCTVTGGVAPFTYLWTEVSSDGTWNILSATSASTAFEAVSVSPSNSVHGEFKCTVTDANGVTAETGNVAARAVNLGGGL
jgi:hypothetical protein